MHLLYGSEFTPQHYVTESTQTSSSLKHSWDWPVLCSQRGSPLQAWSRPLILCSQSSALSHNRDILSSAAVITLRNSLFVPDIIECNSSANLYLAQRHCSFLTAPKRSSSVFSNIHVLQHQQAQPIYCLTASKTWWPWEHCNQTQGCNPYPWNLSDVAWNAFLPLL